MPLSDAALTEELAPVVAGLVDRHLTNTKEWFPHRLVPWSRGEDIGPDYEWDPADTVLSDEVQSAMIVDLLTEDNLPYYFETIYNLFGKHEPWGVWARRWTAEEGRHAIVIRDYLHVTRAVDLDELERGRMAQVSLGEVPHPESVQDGLAYVTMQELATKISHRNTGRLLDDKVGYQVMAQVAGDEQLHHVFYRDAATAALEADPDGMVMAIDRQVRTFAMPGTGIPGFAQHAKRIARAQIYDMQIHLDQILRPMVIDHWKLPELEGLSPEADEARTTVLKYLERVDSAAKKMAARRDREIERELTSA
ncbi:acyl-ACP desaturase [Actinospongicola halichondriae]|uniref:acyl-ACP desaturase n=1 Tax=Actinospongicola halichondriae TaxID=3236844 RepID=UPI003D434DF5